MTWVEFALTYFAGTVVAASIGWKLGFRAHEFRLEQEQLEQHLEEARRRRAEIEEREARKSAYSARILRALDTYNRLHPDPPNRITIAACDRKFFVDSPRTMYGVPVSYDSSYPPDHFRIIGVRDAQQS